MNKIVVLKLVTLFATYFLVTACSNDDVLITSSSLEKETSQHSCSKQ